MDLSNGPNPRRLEVVKVPNDSEHVFTKLELARQRAGAAALVSWGRSASTLDLPYWFSLENAN